MIDRMLHAIPPNVQKMVRLGVLAVWGVLVIFVVIWSFRAGSDSAPQTGDDMYLSNIKEKVYRDRMKRDPADVTLPDLNELSKEEVAPLSVYEPESTPPRGEESSPEISPLPMKGEDDDVIFPEKGVRPERRGEPAPKASEPALMSPER
jgi:hypothetical protein